MKTGSQQWYDLFHARGTRRDFLRVGTSVAGLVAMGGLPACSGERAPRLGDAPFPFGVASGDPLPDGVVLWTRLGRHVLDARGAAAERIPVRWEVAADEAFRTVVRSGSTLALPELGHSVHAEVAGLEPGRTYWYRFDAGGGESVVGRTRTAPDPRSSPDHFRLAFASCQNYEHGYYTAYRHMATEDLDLVVHLGDYIYEKRFGQDYVRQHEADEVVTLDGYRGRYALYRSDPDLQAAHAAFPWVVTPDDHEVDNNWAGTAAEDRQSPEELLLRRAAAFQAYYEFMPLRRASMPMGPDIRLYRRLRFGELVEMSVVDTRQYRSDQPCGDRSRPPCPESFDPTLTMFGPEQERWLFEGLSASTARWNVLANQVMIARLARKVDGAIAVSMDRWDGYVAAQKRLLGFLADRRPTNTVVLTGDIHSNWVADIAADFADPRAPAVATEFVGTSISSGGDGRETFPQVEETFALNPHLRFYNGQRGYVRCTVAPDRWTADYQVVPYVTRPGAPLRTAASFVVEDGVPGARRA